MNAAREQTGNHSPCFHVPLTLLVSELGDKTNLGQGSHGTKVVEANDHGLLDRFLVNTPTQVRDHTVATGGSVLHYAGVAIDSDRVVVAHENNSRDGV